MFAFLRLAGVPFTHEHIFDVSKAPRGQLPYIVDDDGETIGDSETIVAHVIAKYRPAVDAGLTTGAARHRSPDYAHARRPLLGHVVFALEGRALLARVPRRADAGASVSLDEAGSWKAREFNFQRYHYQGIGRYAPEAAYARGVADLAVLAHVIPAEGYVHGPAPAGIDAGIYGFIANIYFFDIDTPLKRFVLAHGNLVRHCRAIHKEVAPAIRAVATALECDRQRPHIK